MTQPIKHYSIIAIAGPEARAKQARHDLIEAGLYNKVHAFGHADDYGEYPDTTGYESNNWEDVVLLNEDSALFKYMTKCMDAVLDYVNKKYDYASEMFPGKIEKHIHWPKLGGKMFFVTGHVVVEAGKIDLLN